MTCGRSMCGRFWREWHRVSARQTNCYSFSDVRVVYQFVVAVVILAVAVATSACGAAVLSQNGVTQARVEATSGQGAACDASQAWTEDHRGDGRVFAATSPDDFYNARRSTWTEYESLDALRAASSAINMHYQAIVWTAPSGRFVVTDEWSFSEDWLLEADYCFNADGTISRMASQLRFLPGRSITRRSVYYSSSGRESRREVSYYDLDNERRLSDEESKGPQVADAIRPVVYTRIRDLPFHKLLAK